MTDTLTLPEQPSGFTCTRTMIGYGGFARVYHGRDAKGNELAVKVFREPEEKSQHRRETWTARIEAIMNNVRTLKNELPNTLFAIPLIVPARSAWYAMPFVAGIPYQRVVDSNTSTPTDQRDATTTYSTALKHLHERGRLFWDNNWGAVLLGNKQTRIADYDFASPIAALQAPWHFARAIGAQEYLSREQRLSGAKAPLELIPPITPLSDLEGFALMLDHLYNGEPLINTAVDHLDAIVAAEKNTRRYSEQRREKLPAPLRDVMTGLIAYPRNPDITIDDLISGLGSTYRS